MSIVKHGNAELSKMGILVRPRERLIEMEPAAGSGEDSDDPEGGGHPPDEARTSPRRAA